jgi:transcriptional regulator with XRE-family HTH domain
VAGLRDKESRDIFVEEEIKTGVPFQIRALRKDRGWSQRELAAQIGMTQEGVSRLENPNYGKFTFTTLLRLASAFDVGLMVRFAPFSELVDWVVNLDSDDMAVPDFDHDPSIREEQDSTIEGVVAADRPLGGVAFVEGTLDVGGNNIVPIWRHPAWNMNAESVAVR